MVNNKELSIDNKLLQINKYDRIKIDYDKLKLHEDIYEEVVTKIEGRPIFYIKNINNIKIK